MKRLIVLILMMTIVIVSCNKEDAIKPSADFTTNIENNTIVAGQSFIVYVDDVQGDFRTYFRGQLPANTYDPNDPTRRGTAFANDVDSLIIPGYPVTIPNDTVFVFTIVASSSGNWADDYLQDVKSVNINVLKPVGK